jgi:hypothetical protein
VDELLVFIALVFFHAQPVVPLLLTPRPCSVASFEVNSEPHTGARPSVRLCVGPELARCIHDKK